MTGTTCNEGANKAEEPYLIQHVYSEFNTVSRTRPRPSSDYTTNTLQGAFLVFQGDFVPTTSAACTTNQKRSEGAGYLAAWTAFGRKLGLQ